MRDVTPPPPSMRAVTPPAPRWGAKDDSWDPFTPRRSSRVAAQRSKFANLSSSARTTAQTFSPPSSPESPSKRPPPSPSKLSKKPPTAVRPRKIRRASPATSESEHDHTALHKDQLLGVTNGEPSSMLPTPIKTPRKRQVPKEVLTATSRVLFHGRLANVEDAMPSPRKSRKSKAFSLYDDTGVKTDKIEVYEDSKERIPTVDDDEDNPFLIKSNKKPSPSTLRGRRRMVRDERMEQTVRNDEGLIYVFRGKTMLRKFEEAEAGDDDDDNLSDMDIRRRAGVSPTPRMTRSTLKPRILFPTEEQKRAREAAEAEEADEEAVTDIEVPSPSLKRASLNKRVHLAMSTSEDAQPSVQPVVHFDNSAESHPATNELLITPDGPSEPQLTNKRLERPKKPRSASPFDKWSRVKPMESKASETKSTPQKREASPMERSAKRVRS